jgi:hypothetical protein
MQDPVELHVQAAFQYSNRASLSEVIRSLKSQRDFLSSRGMTTRDYCIYCNYKSHVQTSCQVSRMWRSGVIISHSVNSIKTGTITQRLCF